MNWQVTMMINGIFIHGVEAMYTAEEHDHIRIVTT